MTDADLDRQLINAVENADYEVLIQPSVRVAKQALIDTLAAAKQQAADEEAAALKADAERRAADPRYALDFDRTECSPDCEAYSDHAWQSRIRHTRTLGRCTEAKRPASDPATVVALGGHLDDVLDVHRYESGYQDSAEDIADYALVWLREHPEAVAAIWPAGDAEESDPKEPK